MSNMNEGLTKKEGFKPSASSPPKTSTNGRPKHDNSMIKRHTGKGKSC